MTECIAWSVNVPNPSAPTQKKKNNKREPALSVASGAGCFLEAEKILLLA